jgi:hypothetical protein
MDQAGLGYVLVAILFCGIGGLLIRGSSELADWQAHMYDGIRRATSGRERAFWDWVPSSYTDPESNERFAKVFGLMFVAVGCLMLLAYIGWTLWTRLT